MTLLYFVAGSNGIMIERFEGFKSRSLQADLFHLDSF